MQSKLDVLHNTIADLRAKDKQEIKELDEVVGYLRNDMAHVRGVIEQAAVRHDALEEQVGDHIAQCTDTRSRDQNSIRSALASKADVGTAEELEARLNDLARDVAQKPGSEDVETVAQRLEEQHTNDMRSMREDLEQRMTLFDAKADVGEVNDALEKVTQIARDVQLEGVQQHLDSEHARIDQIIGTETCVGRWVWNSCKLKGGYGVPWNAQTANTIPDVLQWEKDKVHITVTQPGLYEVSFAFFARKRSTAQLLVNGEPVLGAVTSPSSVTGDKASDHKGRHKGTGGISGLTLMDFLALPPQARIAVSYDGDVHAEGFLQLRQL